MSLCVHILMCLSGCECVPVLCVCTELLATQPPAQFSRLQVCVCVCVCRMALQACCCVPAFGCPLSCCCLCVVSVQMVARVRLSAGAVGMTVCV